MKVINKYQNNITVKIRGMLCIVCMAGLHGMYDLGMYGIIRYSIECYGINSMYGINGIYRME